MTRDDGLTSRLKTVLQTHYDIGCTQITRQQGGWAALAFKATDGNRAYFLKAYEKRRASTPKWTALIDHYVPVIAWLAQHTGLNGKIPVPLSTISGAYKCEDEDAIYMLYDYIDGETIGDRSLTGVQAEQLAEIVAELHTYGHAIPISTDAIGERFDVPFIRHLRSVLLARGGKRLPDDAKERIKPYEQAVHRLMDMVEELAEKLKRSDLPMVLCHTDIHH